MRTPLPVPVKRVIRRLASTKLYPRPVSALSTARLYAYLDAIWQRREVEGAIVEVGCWLGGTAALATRMLRQTGFPKRYVCIDTFQGFVREHFERDLGHGTAACRHADFAGNSLETVERLLKHWGCPEVELVQGDIGSVDDALIPAEVSVALVDVDLDLPSHQALQRLYPRLVAGGIVLVDDCPENGDWPGARAAYTRFVREHGLPERYFMGMGLVER